MTSGALCCARLAQYVLLSTPPEREAQFQRLKAAAKRQRVSGRLRFVMLRQRALTTGQRICVRFPWLTNRCKRFVDLSRSDCALDRQLARDSAHGAQEHERHSQSAARRGARRRNLLSLPVRCRLISEYLSSTLSLFSVRAMCSAGCSFQYCRPGEGIGWPKSSHGTTYTGLAVCELANTHTLPEPKKVPYSAPDARF